jgi:hypothetical protein
MYLDRDQTTGDPGIKLLNNAWVNQTPFVVVVGKKYNSFPWSLGFRPPQKADSGPAQGDDDDVEDDNASYAVLGWYRVKHYWCEYEPGRAGGNGVPLFIRWRFLFEWVVEQGPPWWLQRPPAPTIIGASDDTVDDESLSVDATQSKPTTGMFRFGNPFVL